MRVADAATGKPLGETTKLGEDVGTAVLSPDQQRVLTISSHNTDLQVWDTATGKPIGAPINHGGGIDSAVFSPDGQRVLTVSGDGTWGNCGRLRPQNLRLESSCTKAP